MRKIPFYKALIICLIVFITSCETSEKSKIEDNYQGVTPEYYLKRDQTHNKFSRTIEPVLSVPSGAVIQAETEEATDGQLNLNSTRYELTNLDFNLIHPLTGPVYVEGAMPGDVLAVTLHKIDLDGWGWTGILPGFSFLAEEYTVPFLKTYEIERGATDVSFNEKTNVPLNPFPGVMGVAPDTDSLLSTIPPRANGGNMDDPNMVEGVTVYFPVFVEGALFSIGDTHAAQGMGEVCGTAIEAPMTIVYSVEVLKDFHRITEPQYESDEYFAVTAYGRDIDEAARKATRFMVNYLVEEHSFSREEAYALCSIAGDLKIAEVVDVPHMLVSMHMSKEVLGTR